MLAIASATTFQFRIPRVCNDSALCRVCREAHASYAFAMQDAREVLDIALADERYTAVVKYAEQLKRYAHLRDTAILFAAANTCEGLFSAPVVGA